MKRKVMLCMGTRPEIIKMAPVHHAINAAGMQSVVFHTGQHRDIAMPMYRLFDIKPAQEVTKLDRKGGSLAELGSALLDSAHHAIEAEQPEVVLVHGDTSSALMAALAAFYHELPIGHVEAGLRTGSMYDPFPEEMNRRLVARLARWHFAPTRGARASLQSEGVPASGIHMVGNTAVDAAQEVARRVEANPNLARWPAELAPLALLPTGSRLVLVTAHRRENWGDGMRNIAAAVSAVIDTQPDVTVVWPVHPNPDVREAVESGTQGARARHTNRLLLCPPLDYACLVVMLRRAWLVMTDSGGIQEEAAGFGTPVLVLRATTERPELISAGGAELVGSDPQRILVAVKSLAESAHKRAAMRVQRNPFGDGTAASRIARILASSGVHVAGLTRPAELEDY
ncbi:MAG TPA: UDP-N-acetylglucosamine 2-epimerase (non-hydrolyzing) [Burkholderiaceae bacterium]